MEEIISMISFDMIETLTTTRPYQGSTIIIEHVFSTPEEQDLFNYLTDSFGLREILHETQNILVRKRNTQLSSKPSGVQVHYRIFRPQ